MRASDIRIAQRVRRDLGDTTDLQRSIADLGLLHPVVVTPDGTLIAGARRLRAVAALGWDDVPVNVVDIDAVVLGEHAENELRKDFTASERVEIGRLVDAALGERRGRPSKEKPQNLAEFPVGTETRQIAAEKAGFGNAETYRQAKTVVAHGVPELVERMDAGDVAISVAAALAKLSTPEQVRLLAAEDKARISEAAKTIWHEKAETRRAASAALKASTPPVVIQSGKYRTIVIDPPWPVDRVQRVLRPIQTALDYPTMTEDELDGVTGRLQRSCGCGRPPE